MPDARPRTIRRPAAALLAAGLLALVAGLRSSAEEGALASPVAGQSASAAAVVARRIGLCQCLDDKTGVHLACMAGAVSCQKSCASPHFAFVPAPTGVLRQCPPRELYVVLPNADGRPGSGAISVEEGGGSTLLDQPYLAAATLRGQGAATISVGETEVKAIFHRALDARPLLPSHFMLTYPLGGVDPVPEDMAEYRKVLADIKRRPVYQVEVIGYTDTVADAGFNEKLGLERAERVRRALIRDGVGEKTISIASRGKTELLVPTPDQVAEPHNRRVEVTVR